MTATRGQERAHVQEGPHRQPRRDRAAHPPRLQGDGHQDGRRPFDGRRRRHARAARRRERLHRPAAGGQSYLKIPTIIAACEITDAEAIHPGYGFLSENARFAEIVENHGLTFIGPKPEHIRMMGDKITAKQTMKAARRALVPGSDGAVTTIEEARKVGGARSAFR